MKVWWVLAWYHYYPQGGLENVQSMHETREEAVAAANELRADSGWDEVEVVNISGRIGLK